MSGIAKAGRKWQKMNDSSYGKLLSNTLVFAIGSFSSKILVLILIPIYTGYLTRAEQGITDVLTQIANWMIPLATMTISEAMIRFGLDKAYDKRRVFTLGNLICGTGMAIFALVLFIVDLTGIADNYIGGYALLLYAYVFMSGMKTLYTTFVRAMEKVKLFALAGIIATVFTLFFIVMFYIVLPPSFLGEGTGIQKYLLATILSDLITTVFVAVAAKLWRFIDFKKDSNEIVILWDRILECGEVAVRLADCPGCNVKETMQGGEFHPQQAPTMRELMNEARGDDPEKRKREPHEDYVKAGLDKLERLTEEEFQRWLRTGCAYPSDLPDDLNYVPPVEDPIDWDPDDVMGTKTPSCWIEGKPNDHPDGWKVGDEMNEELGF